MKRLPEYTVVLRETKPGVFVIVSLNRISIPLGHVNNLRVKQQLTLKGK